MSTAALQTPVVAEAFVPETSAQPTSPLFNNNSSRDLDIRLDFGRHVRLATEPTLLNATSNATLAAWMAAEVLGPERLPPFFLQPFQPSHSPDSGALLPTAAWLPPPTAPGSGQQLWLRFHLAPTALANASYVALMVCGTAVQDTDGHSLPAFSPLSLCLFDAACNTSCAGTEHIPGHNGTPVVDEGSAPASAQAGEAAARNLSLAGPVTLTAAPNLTASIEGVVAGLRPGMNVEVRLPDQIAVFGGETYTVQFPFALHLNLSAEVLVVELNDTGAVIRDAYEVEHGEHLTRYALEAYAGQDEEAVDVAVFAGPWEAYQRDEMRLLFETSEQATLDSLPKPLKDHTPAELDAAFESALFTFVDAFTFDELSKFALTPEGWRQFVSSGFRCARCSARNAGSASMHCDHTWHEIRFNDSLAYRLLDIASSRVVPSTMSLEVAPPVSGQPLSAAATGQPLGVSLWAPPTSSGTSGTAGYVVAVPVAPVGAPTMTLAVADLGFGCGQLSVTREAFLAQASPCERLPNSCATRALSLLVTSALASSPALTAFNLTNAGGLLETVNASHAQLRLSSDTASSSNLTVTMPSAPITVAVASTPDQSTLCVRVHGVWDAGTQQASVRLDIDNSASVAAGVYDVLVNCTGEVSGGGRGAWSGNETVEVNGGRVREATVVVGGVEAPVPAPALPLNCTVRVMLRVKPLWAGRIAAAEAACPFNIEAAPTDAGDNDAGGDGSSAETLLGVSPVAALILIGASGLVVIGGILTALVLWWRGLRSTTRPGKVADGPGLSVVGSKVLVPAPGDGAQRTTQHPHALKTRPPSDLSITEIDIRPLDTRSRRSSSSSSVVQSGKAGSGPARAAPESTGKPAPLVLFDFEALGAGCHLAPLTQHAEQRLSVRGHVMHEGKLVSVSVANITAIVLEPRERRVWMHTPQHRYLLQTPSARYAAMFQELQRSAGFLEQQTQT